MNLKLTLSDMFQREPSTDVLNQTDKVFRRDHDDNVNLESIDDRVKPYIYNLELMDLVLEQKARSTMNKKKMGKRDLDRLYMTQSDYKEHLKLRNSVTQQSNTL